MSMRMCRSSQTVSGVKIGVPFRGFLLPLLSRPLKLMDFPCDEVGLLRLFLGDILAM